MGLRGVGFIPALMVLTLTHFVLVDASSKDALLPSLLGGGVNVVFSPVVDIETNVNSPTSNATPAPPSSGLSVALPSVVSVRTNIKSPTDTREIEEPATSPPQEQKPKGRTIVIPSLLRVKTTATTTDSTSNRFSPGNVHATTDIDVAGLGALSASVLGAVSKTLSQLAPPPPPSPTTKPASLLRHLDSSTMRHLRCSN